MNMGAINISKPKDVIKNLDIFLEASRNVIKKNEENWDEAQFVREITAFIIDELYAHLEVLDKFVKY